MLGWNTGIDGPGDYRTWKTRENGITEERPRDMDKTGVELDAWVRMYEEPVRHVRHHESLRSSSTNIAVVVSTGVLGLFAADMVSDQRWMLALFLILVNVYGLMMSLKHYERSRLHHAVSGRYRAVISEASKFDSYVLNELRCHAQSEHKARRSLMSRVRAYWMWCGLLPSSHFWGQACCGANHRSRRAVAKLH